MAIYHSNLLAFSIVKTCCGYKLLCNCAHLMKDVHSHSLACEHNRVLIAYVHIVAIELYTPFAVITICQ